MNFLIIFLAIMLPFWQNSSDIYFLPAEIPEYSMGVKNPDTSIFIDKNISGKMVYCEQYAQFIEVPAHLREFINKGSDVCVFTPTFGFVDAYWFVRNSDNHIIQNTGEINENTKISLLVRTNYATGIENNQNKDVYKSFETSTDNDIASTLLEEKFSEFWVFLSEEIVGKCEKLKCEFPSKKLPIFMRENLENPDNAYWFAEGRSGVEKVFFENGKFIVIFSENADLGESFIFHFSKV